MYTDPVEAGQADPTFSNRTEESVPPADRVSVGLVKPEVTQVGSPNGTESAIDPVYPLILAA